MEIILRINGVEYSVISNTDTPDTDNVMYAIESLIKKVPLDRYLVNEYIVAWAEEIQNKV